MCINTYIQFRKIEIFERKKDIYVYIHITKHYQTEQKSYLLYFFSCRALFGTIALFCIVCVMASENWLDEIQHVSVLSMFQTSKSLVLCKGLKHFCRRSHNTITISHLIPMNHFFMISMINLMLWSCKVTVWH